MSETDPKPLPDLYGDDGAVKTVLGIGMVALSTEREKTKADRLLYVDAARLAKAQVDVADLVRINAELSRRAQTAERERDAFAMLAASVIEGKGLHEDKVNRLMEPVEGWVPDIARIRRLAGLEEA